MKGAVGPVAATRALQGDVLGDDVEDVQPAFDVVDYGHFIPRLFPGPTSGELTRRLRRLDVSSDRLYQPSRPTCAGQSLEARILARKVPRYIVPLFWGFWGRGWGRGRDIHRRPSVPPSRAPSGTSGQAQQLFWMARRLGFQGVLWRRMAFRMVRSLCMQATNATFLGLC